MKGINMMESKPNLIPDESNVNTGPISIADITVHVLKQKAANQFYDPKTDQTLLEWSKKGKFTLSTFNANQGTSHKLIFNKGEVYETTNYSGRNRSAKSKFFPKNRRN